MNASAPQAALYPLSSVQQGMVLASLRAPTSGAYIVQEVCEFASGFDPERFRRAWRMVAERHPALRTSIEAESGELGQRVRPEPEIEWRELDWRDAPAAESEPRLEAFLREDWRRGFDFAAGTPMRFTLARNPDDSSTLVWTAHHALLDGRSYAIVWRELFHIYDRLLDGRAIELPAPLPGPLRSSGQADTASRERFWRNYLRDLPETTDDYIDRTAPGGAPGATFSKYSLRLSEDLTNALREFSGRRGLTLHTLIQGAWALLLSRYTGRSDIVFGVTRAGRRPEDSQRVGVSINTLPVRIRVLPDIEAGQWLDQIRRDWIVTRDYGDASLENLREWCGFAPGTPLFHSLLVYDHEPPGETLLRIGGGARLRRFRRVQRTDMPLTVAAYGKPVVTLDLIYDVHRFSGSAIARMAGHLEMLLAGFVEQPDCRLGALPMLTPAEQQWFALQESRSGSYSYERCAHALIEDQARKNAGRVAMEFPGGSMTYGELDRTANRLARVLREKGAISEDLAALLLDNSPDTVIAMLAVLKAGAAFLLLDRAAPPERLTGMLADADPTFVIARTSDLSLAGPRGLDIDELFASASAQPADDLDPAAHPNDAAYAIYTSGSTGRPKAIVVTHRSLVNHTMGACAAFDLAPDDRRLQFLSPSTDVFIAEIFNYLSSGATLVFGWDRRNGSLRDFVRFIDEHRITITGVPASWWREWVAALTHGQCLPPASLRAVASGMEQANPEALAVWRRIAGRQVRWFNAYGPAETTPTSAVYEAGSSEWEGRPAVPIGRPFPNVRAYVLDAHGGRAPIGIPGELYIGGAGVARGYLKQPDLTQRAFLPDPFSGAPAARMYKTGDIAYYLPDGNLVCLGRADRQVKIRGHRVQLDEIEAVLGLDPGVAQCAVAPRDGMLLGFFTSNGEGPPAPDRLRQLLARFLPHYMIPARFELLEKMPVLTNGKIDLKALVSLELPPMASAQADDPPVTGTERRLSAIWSETLGGAVGITADFFESGGDSLRATRLITLIHAEFGRELSLADLWQARTIAGLAAMLDAAPETRKGGSAVVLRSKGHGRPLFCVSASKGDAIGFRHLADRFGEDRPFVVLPNPVGSRAELQTVEELGAQICREMRAVEPRGPYLIGGYCFGGVVAFETAHHLIDAGEEVLLLALLDTPAPGYPKLLPRGRRDRSEARRFLASARRAGLDEMLSHLRFVSRLIGRRTADRGRRAMARAGVRPAMPATADPAEIAEIARRSVALYQPKPISVPVVQFIAEGDTVSTRVLDDPRMGWGDLCERFTVRRLTSSHSSLLLEANADELALRLRETVDLADR
jgi:amino acid adenylation domain-containing protein